MLDLEAKGLLDRTLVIVASEFSRDMMIEGVPGSTAKDQSRARSKTLQEMKHYGLHRHFTGGTSVLMYGGGVKRGYQYGKTADERLAVRRELSAPAAAELEDWMRQERAKLSRNSPLAKAMDYMLTRWPAFTGFLEDGRFCLTNNAAERALRGIALGRKSWLFAGSDRGGDRAAFMYTLIETAKLNEVDPQAWLAHVLANIAGTPQNQLNKLLPWNWKPSVEVKAA